MKYKYGRGENPERRREIRRERNEQIEINEKITYDFKILVNKKGKKKTNIREKQLIKK